MEEGTHAPEVPPSTARGLIGCLCKVVELLANQRGCCTRHTRNCPFPHPPPSTANASEHQGRGSIVTRLWPGPLDFPANGTEVRGRALLSSLQPSLCLSCSVKQRNETLYSCRTVPGSDAYWAFKGTGSLKTGGCRKLPPLLGKLPGKAKAFMLGNAVV